MLLSLILEFCDVGTKISLPVVNVHVAYSVNSLLYLCFSTKH